MDLPLPFVDPQASFLLNHASSTPLDADLEVAPALQVSIRGPLKQSGCGSRSEAVQTRVLIQPLQLLYQPLCLARIAAVLSSPAERDATTEMLEVISALESPGIQALSMAELACSIGSLPSLSLEVCHPAHMASKGHGPICGSSLLGSSRGWLITL